MNPVLLSPGADFLIGLLPNEVVTAPLQARGMTLDVRGWHTSGRPPGGDGGRGWLPADRVRLHRTSGEEPARVAVTAQGPAGKGLMEGSQARGK